MPGSEAKAIKSGVVLNVSRELYKEEYTGVTLVGVGFHLSLCKVELILRHELVESEGRTADGLACTAVAE